jgi:hypothetical protein
VLTMMGVVTGAGVGALVGASLPGWRTVYRRDAPTETRSGRSGPSRGSRP